MANTNIQLPCSQLVTFAWIAGWCYYLYWYQDNQYQIVLKSGEEESSGGRIHEMMVYRLSMIDTVEAKAALN